MGRFEMGKPAIIILQYKVRRKRRSSGTKISGTKMSGTACHFVERYPGSSMIDQDNGIDIDPLHTQSATACVRHRVWRNPNRLLLLCQLTQGQYRISDLAGRLSIQAPTLSQQPGLLHPEKRTTTRRRGKPDHCAVASGAAPVVLSAVLSALLPLVHQHGCRSV